VPAGSLLSFFEPFVLWMDSIPFRGGRALIWMDGWLDGCYVVFGSKEIFRLCSGTVGNRQAS